MRGKQTDSSIPGTCEKKHNTRQNNVFFFSNSRLPAIRTRRTILIVFLAPCFSLLYVSTNMLFISSLLLPRPTLFLAPQSKTQNGTGKERNEEKHGRKQTERNTLSSVGKKEKRKAKMKQERNEEKHARKQTRRNFFFLRWQKNKTGNNKQTNQTRP